MKKQKKRKYIRKYTIVQRSFDLKRQEERTFDRLLLARKYGQEMKRMGRFISLHNIKGVKLTL